MPNVVLLVFGAAFGLTVLERLYPAREPNPSFRWSIVAFLVNLLQLLPAVLGQYTWEKYLVQAQSIFNLQNVMNPFLGGFFAYFVASWIFYWWHRLRHDRRWIWLVFHQFHHSVRYNVVLAAFFKHPLEITVNSVVATILVYPVMGLSLEANAWYSIFSAYGEFFYHLNVKTPHWLGYLIQRPESHCAHHWEDKVSSEGCPNLADFPIWDILGGTFFNPHDHEVPKIGFSRGRDNKLFEMLIFRNVLDEEYKKLNWQSVVSIYARWFRFIRDNWFQILTEIALLLMVILGSLSVIGLLTHTPAIRGVGFMSGASPLPFVFSKYNGIETFATKFDLDIAFQNGTETNILLDGKLYNRLQGPYNRRNVFGAIFSHGPFFDKANMIKIRQQILHWGLCQPGNLAHEFGFETPIKSVIVNIRSKTAGQEGKLWQISTVC